MSHACRKAPTRGRGDTACLRRLAMRSAYLCCCLLSLAALPDAAGASMAPPQAVVESIREAGAAYEADRYGEAVECYRQALALGWCSAELYYNLGCASYKAGRIGWAVTYLEEARRLSPRDPNIRHNLRTVTSKGRDRLPEEEASRLLVLLSGLLDSYSPSDVVRTILALFWLGALVLAVHWT